MRYYEIVAEGYTDIIEKNFNHKQAENNAIMMGIGLEDIKKLLIKQETAEQTPNEITKTKNIVQPR